MGFNSGFKGLTTLSKLYWVMKQNEHRSNSLYRKDTQSGTGVAQVPMDLLAIPKEASKIL